MAKNIAIFAAGCFWGVQYYFDQVPGVVESSVGYIGGHVKNPTYEQVCTHTTGHAEAVRLVYDEHRIEYSTLVRHFFRMHDPTQLNRQGPDVGDSYRSAIFYTSEKQKEIAEQVLQELAPTYDETIMTQIEQAGHFYDAEEYHQKFSEKTGQGICHVPYTKIR